MKGHITVAHRLWKEVVEPGDLVIDATVGNGHDTLYLAQLLQGKGQLVGYDIQKEALFETERRLAALPTKLPKIVTLKLASHATFAEVNPKLIIYNLGYLPGGDKSITTRRESTLSSIEHALEIATHAISITCYPGHPEGKHEEEALLTRLERLSSSEWRVYRYHLINQPHAPSLLWLTTR
ncbi:MAG: hypothetical protein K940chlam9_00630 [Chlamydiae bacterium]|nr:hypothetical protein [Chlamydiota bacterium]